MKILSLTILKSLAVLLSLSLTSCQVSPLWGPPSSGLSQDSNSVGGASVLAQAGYFTLAPDEGGGRGSYLTASRMARPSPVMTQRPQVIVPRQLQQSQRPRTAPVPQLVRPLRSPQVSRGKVRLVNGLAIAPPDAPPVVRRAIAAGNRLQNFPYKWGGGHAILDDTGYDCSGAVSYVLREAGIMPDQRTSRGFLNYGEAGEGDWITVWSKDGHVFMIIGGLRLDTGGSTQRTGPRWKAKSRHYKGFLPRHPRGL